MMLNSLSVQKALLKYKENVVDINTLFQQFNSKYILLGYNKTLVNRIINLTTLCNSTFEQFYNSITFGNKLYRELSIDQFVECLKGVLFDK